MTDSIDAIRWQDELLQIMYWYRGEGLGDQVTAGALVVFLGVDEATIATRLSDLVESGYAERVLGQPGYFTLTERGIKEGGRRFADEFAGLTNQGHGECNNPSCSCHTLGPEACVAHVPHSH